MNLNSSNNYDFEPIDETSSEDNYDFEPLKEFDEPLATPEEDVAKDKNQPKSFLRDIGETAGQFTRGLAEANPFVAAHDIASSISFNKSFQETEQRFRMTDELEDLYFKNQGKPVDQWPEEDRKWLEDIKQYWGRPEKIREEIKPLDITLRGLIEKATGQDLTPKGAIQKSAHFLGFLKDPRKIAEFVKNPKLFKEFTKIGLNPKKLKENMLPFAHDVFRSMGAGTALQMAEEGKFGPTATVAAMVIGDTLGRAPKAVFTPKQTLQNIKKASAHAVNLLTMNNTKRLIANQIAEDFAKSNIPVDAGTLTDSNLVKWVQARLTQSGLTGEALDNLRKSISQSITNEYESILSDLGELTFQNSHQAGEALKKYYDTFETQLHAPRNLAKEAERATKESPLKGRVSSTPPENPKQVLLDKITPTPMRSTAEGGRAVKKQATVIRDEIYSDLKKRWDTLEKALESVPISPQVQLASELSSFISENSDSLLLGSHTAEARVIRTAQDLLNKLEKQGSYQGVTIKQLIDTKRTLGAIADWEFAGKDFKSAYKKLYDDVGQAIETSLRPHPGYLGTYLELNSDYNAYKLVFENPNVRRVFSPKDFNYNTLYKEITSNPDKFKAIENVLSPSEEGRDLIQQIKRDYADSFIGKGELTPREMADLENVLGKEYASDIIQYNSSAQKELLPSASPRERLGLEVERPTTAKEASPRKFEASETSTKSALSGKQKKYADQLKIAEKSPEELFKKMNTLDGIKDLREALSVTPEGKQLFNELSRYKLAEIIDNVMRDEVSNQIKLGTFSGLLSKENKKIVKDLLGQDSYARLELLQRNVGKLAQANAKFFNASQSGTTLSDVASIGALVTGILMGNPWMVAQSAVKYGGSYFLSNLLADPVFLKELQRSLNYSYGKEASKAFIDSMKRMEPTIIRIAQNVNEQQSKESK